MQETTPEFHHLEVALAIAGKLISDLPAHSVGGELGDLKLRSYVLLRHAAVEEYLERASVYVLRECLKEFAERSHVTEPLIAVCCYYEMNLAPTLLDGAISGSATSLFEKICRKAVEAHVTAIDGVHGIKTKDQDTILNPIGIRLHDFDHVLSQKLNSMGNHRGSVAHQFRITHIHPRSALESDTVNLLRLLRPFDNELCRRMALRYHI